MCRLASSASEALGIVEDLQLGSSPTTARAPPVRETPDEVAVAERVGGAVESGRLAVPHGEHAVVARAGQAAGELASPGRGGAELLVQARHVAHVVLRAQLRRGAEAPGRARRAASPGSRRRACPCGVRGRGRRGAGRARSRTRPCTPVRRIRPSSSTYLSSRLTSRRASCRCPRVGPPRRLSARCCLRRSGRSRSAVGFTRLSLDSMLAASLWQTELTIDGTWSATPSWRAPLDCMSSTIGPVPVDVKGNTRYGQE